MIPTGTLCLCVRAPAHPARVGQFCTVIDWPGPLSPVQQCVVRFSDGELYAARWRNLRPIMPPAPAKVRDTELVLAQ